MLEKELHEFMSLTYSEIKDQYSALEKTLDYISMCKEDLRDFYDSKSPRSLVYIGAGSSYCLCRSAELSARIHLGKPATAFAAGELMLHHKDYLGIFEGASLISLSRSGSTSEVLMAVEEIRKYRDVSVAGVVCTSNSKMAEISDCILELPWAFDESVCQTRSVVNLYAANLLAIAYLSDNYELIDQCEKAVKYGHSFIERWESRLADIAREDWSDVVVLADGEMCGLAEEGALAVSEIARVPGRYYHLLDVRHGPVVLIDEKTLVVACLTEDGMQYQKQLVADLVKKGATIVTYSERAFEQIPGVRLQVSSGYRLGPAARGMHFIFLPQMIAYYKAKEKGVDPDYPEGLSPYIKL
jgi:glucosamine--fructose-6-phosphate aminotransferase (isomerizing)